MPFPSRSRRLATLLHLIVVVVIAPLVGVFALAPLAFAWLLSPYPLAAAVGVMAAEGVGLATLTICFPRRD